MGTSSVLLGDYRNLLTMNLLVIIAKNQIYKYKNIKKASLLSILQQQKYYSTQRKMVTYIHRIENAENCLDLYSNQIMNVCNNGNV